MVIYQEYIHDDNRVCHRWDGRSVNLLKGRFQKKKQKKIGKGGVTPIPYLFYFGFCKTMGKMMLSKSVFCVLSGVKITLKNSKISPKIYSI